jgi:hypothetical protein
VIVQVRPNPGGHDAYGDPVAGTVQRAIIEGAFVAPRQSTEPDDRGRAGVVVGLTLYAPHGTQIAPSDLIEVDGVSYHVEGEPGVWEHPATGWRPGVVAALTRAAG